MTDEEAALSLLSAKAVRERAHEVLRLGREGRLAEWRVDMDRLPAAADFVAEVIRRQYPDLEIPFHARRRHFVSDGRNLWAELAEAVGEGEGLARIGVALTIVSVLLDAGSGPGWRYTDGKTGAISSRSEGLGVASLRMFEGGAFSANPRTPLCADAARLSQLSAAELGIGFQVGPENPLLGLEGRAALLRRLGGQIAARPDLFGALGSLGDLFQTFKARAVDGRLSAPDILAVLLEALGPIWEGRLTLGGRPLGDTWRHPALKGDGANGSLVPLHKLSQWLAYSLIEPLTDGGLTITDIDGLTGLAEYRNGGLFIDMGVLNLTDPADAARDHAVSSPLVVGWRAMTVALLDEIAPLVRERLGVPAAVFPLAKLLEGGTWAAGRRIAKDRREGGGPPLAILSDGTVF
ncbi:MAG: URC4/urg3 family protein [Caulobacteraceae bacterium]